MNTIAGDNIQTSKVDKVMKKLKKSKNDTKEFLIEAGVILIKPREYTTITEDQREISTFLDRKVHSHSQQGKYRATFAGPGQENKDAGWRKIEVAWPFQMYKLNRSQELSDFLSNPSDDLFDEYRSRFKPQKGNRIEWTYGQKSRLEEHVHGQATWIVDLQTTEWVKCSDGVIRKPSESPLEGGEGEFHALIDQRFSKIYEKLGVKFGQDTDTMDNDQVLQWWRKNVVRDVDRLISILKEKALKGDALFCEIQDLQFTTTHNVKAPVRRHIPNIWNTLGGYFGSWDDLPKPLINFLNPKINLPKLTPELLIQFIESLTHQSATYIDERIKHLQDVHAKLAEFKFKPTNVKLLTYDDEWEDVKDVSYVFLTDDQNKSDLFLEKSSALINFLNKYLLSLPSLKNTILNYWTMNSAL